MKIAKEVIGWIIFLLIFFVLFNGGFNITTTVILLALGISAFYVIVALNDEK